MKIGVVKVITVGCKWNFAHSSYTFRSVWVYSGKGGAYKNLPGDCDSVKTGKGVNLY